VVRITNMNISNVVLYDSKIRRLTKGFQIYFGDAGGEREEKIRADFENFIGYIERG